MKCIDALLPEAAASSMVCHRILVLAFIAITLCMMSAGTATAATVVTVNASDNATYTNIQDAIDASSTGDTIEVYSGTYYENVLVGKQLTLRGIDTGGGKPMMDAGGNGNAIELSADGITLEGFAVTNATAPETAGIMVGSNNNTITSNNVSNNYGGIYIWLTSNNNTLRNNRMFSNAYNFVLESDSIVYPIEYSSENILKNTPDAPNTPKSARSPNIRFYNTGTTGGSGGGGAGGSLSESLFDNDIDTSNLVEGKPIYYLLDASGTIINSSSNAGMVVCIRCDDIKINDLVITNNGMGIYLYHSNNSSIQNNNIYDNIIGIRLWDSSNITLSDNNFSKNIDGIWLSLSNNNNFTNNNVSNHDFGIILQSSNDNNFTNNNVSNNGDGISLEYSNNNDIMNNDASSNDFGIYFWHSDNNDIISNNVSNNGDGIYLEYSNNNDVMNNDASSNDFGIYFWHSNSNYIINNAVSYNNYSVITDMSDLNLIYHNNFIGNSQNAFDNSGNLWNAGYPTGGNYWSNYTGPDIYSGPDQDVPGSDGIGDTSYSISGGAGANDSYPYMDENGWDADTTPPTVAITSHVGGQIVTTSSITIAGTASDDSGIEYAYVSVNNHIFAAGTTHWNADITLAEGTNIIFVTAIDTAENRASDIISVIYAPVAANIVELKGKVANPTDIADIFSYNTNIVWNASNFAGFDYDSDYGIASKSLTILHDVANSNGDITNLSSLGNDNRTIFEDHLVYDITTEAMGFQYEGFGNYSIIGFMGEPYFTGYDAGVSDFVKNNTHGGDSLDGVSFLTNGFLSRVLIDNDENYTIMTEEGLELSEGYVLYVSQVDIENKKALLELRKNDKSIDTAMVRLGDNPDGLGDIYVYDLDLGGEDNVPLIIARVSTVFREDITNNITIEGLFQISDTLMEISTGDEHGVMEVTDTTGNTIRMKNREYPIYLERNSAKTVMADMMFKVADDNPLSFYPFTILLNPHVSIITEPEEHAYVKGNIDIIGTAKDTNFHNYTVEWKNTTVDWTWINHSTMPVSNGILATLDTTELADGDYAIRLNVTDKASNSNSNTVNVTIDNTLPSASLTQPVEAAYIKGIVDITGAAVDANFLNYTVHRKNATSEWMEMQNSTTPVSDGILATLDTIGLADGAYVIRLNVIDEGYNTKSSSVNITIDNTKPTVTNLSVSTSTPVINSSVNITAEVNDSNLNDSSVSVSVKGPDGFINSTSMTASDDDVYSLAFSNISGYGRYDVTIIASDFAGNINNTETISFVTVMPPYVNESIDATANNREFRLTSVIDQNI